MFLLWYPFFTWTSTKFFSFSKFIMTLLLHLSYMMLRNSSHNFSLSLWFNYLCFRKPFDLFFLSFLNLWIYLYIISSSIQFKVSCKNLRIRLIIYFFFSCFILQVKFFFRSLLLSHCSSAYSLLPLRTHTLMPHTMLMLMHFDSI